MTIKSFKEHAEINENPLKPLLQPAFDVVKPIVKNYVKKTVVPYVKKTAVPYVKDKAPGFSRFVVRNSDKAGAALSGMYGYSKARAGELKKAFTTKPGRRSTTNMNPNTAYSPVKPSAKGQAEEVQLDEKMPPEAHVARSKKNPDMFCVFDKDGKEVKLFKDKKDAEAYAVKNHDQLMGEAGLWANIHKKRERIKRGSGETMRKKGDKGAPKSLDVGEGFASDAQRRAAFASGYKAKGKKEGAMSRIDYQTKSGEKSTGLSTFKKKPVSSDYKPYPKPGKKPLYGDKVDEISRYDLGKKIISTMGTKAPTMLTKHDDEKKKVKTDLEGLRKALGPDHSMNKARA